MRGIGVGREDCKGRVEWCGTSYTGSWKVTKFGAGRSR